MTASIGTTALPPAPAGPFVLPGGGGVPSAPTAPAPLPPAPVAGAPPAPGGATTPAPAPIAAAPVVGGGGATDPTALLQQLVGVVQALVAALSAQAAGGSVVGGGASATMGGGGDALDLRTAIGGEVLGVSAGGIWTDSYNLELAPMGSGEVTGGGGASDTPLLGPMSTTLGGGDVGPSYSVTGSNGGPVSPVSLLDTPTTASMLAPVTGSALAPLVGSQPVAPAAPVGGGGATAPTAPAVDMRRVLGTPQPGGLVDTIIRSAALTVAEARSEGQYIVVTDAAGAQMQVHAHGVWASRPQDIVNGLRMGWIAAHLHDDGTVHLHDVA